MAKRMKNQGEILQKLGIEALNPMQEEAKLAIHSLDEVVLLSPTGTGKTLAFLLPIFSELDPSKHQVQAVVIVPSRELAIQIEHVAREMGTGFKINSVYGGRSFSKDKINLQHNPAMLIGTPGRVADHFRRGTISLEDVQVLVLDEFDKSLEVGFEDEMTEIVQALTSVKKKILTSATQGVVIPDFVAIQNPTKIDYLAEGVSKLTVKRVISPHKDKLETLVELICHIGDHPGIIFCNFKDTIRRVSDFLTFKGIDHGCFYGGMEQRDRERALIKFRNGTHNIIIATDLAARGIDIPELRYIVHYHLPMRAEEFTHRNGRTARMKSDGTAYVLQWSEEILPDFINAPSIELLSEAEVPPRSKWVTMFISGGRRDKISKGDIAGLFFKQGQLKRDELGAIELNEDCAFAAVLAVKMNQVIKYTDNSRLKKKKVRVHEI